MRLKLCLMHSRVCTAASSVWRPALWPSARACGVFFASRQSPRACRFAVAAPGITPEHQTSGMVAFSLMYISTLHSWRGTYLSPGCYSPWCILTYPVCQTCADAERDVTSQHLEPYKGALHCRASQGGTRATWRSRRHWEQCCRPGAAPSGGALHPTRGSVVLHSIQLVLHDPTSI